MADLFNETRITVAPSTTLLDSASFTIPLILNTLCAERDFDGRNERIKKNNSVAILYIRLKFGPKVREFQEIKNVLTQEDVKK